MLYSLAIFIAGMLFMRVVENFLKDIFEKGVKKGKKLKNLGSK